MRHFIAKERTSLKRGVNMAVSEIHLTQNNALQKMTSFTVILPEGKSGPFPVFYLLHGLSDDHTAWQRWSSIERYVRDLPLIVVMPNGERGWYTDAVADPKAAFETLIVRDVVGFVDRTFQTIPTREGRVIAGLSMGGYGALKLALKHPDLFCAAVSHSGAVEMASRPLDAENEWDRERIPVFGPDPQGGDNDLTALVTRSDPATRPSLRIDCGVDDFLIEHNRRFHALLTGSGVPHEYAEHPGAHDWVYWDQHVQDTIAFFSKRLWPEKTA
jgi:putative tributyrin esterase